MTFEIITRDAPAADLLFREAALGAQSWSAEARTFEVIVSSGADVERRDARGPYVERIDVRQDWSGLRGAPVLNSHQRSDIRNILGSVTAVGAAAGRVLATIRMSTSPEGEAAVQAAREGHLRGVSFGYRIEETCESVEGGRRVVTVTKLTPIELSLVPIGADPAAVIRSSQMDQTTTTDPPAPALFDRAQTNVQIRAMARLSGLPQTWIDGQIDANATVAEAQSAAFEAMRLRSAVSSTIQTVTAGISGHDANDPQWRRATISEAIFCRMSGAAPSDAARPYVGLSLVEVARDCLRVRGFPATGTPSMVVERAFFETTSDLPAIMADAINKSMRQSYESAPSGLKRVARQTTSRDFRAKHRIQMSFAPALLPINEHGEFQAGGISDTEETYKLATYGRILSFSRQAYTNDDLGALDDATRRMGVSAANFEAQFLTNLVTANAAMKDTYNVFSTQYGNLAGTGTAISDTSLATARLAMRSQTEMSGVLINVVPRYLVVPAALETLAEKTLTAIRATQTTDVNVWSSLLGVVCEPRLTDAKKWYLVADPAQIEGLEYAYLDGEQGPQIFSEVGFDIDGLRFKIRLDFGGAFVEPRGWYCYPGA
jgi:hypothetical protein